MENTYSAQEELVYIRKIITESRQAFVEDGKPYILWGVIVAVCMTLTYISVLTQTELYVGYAWLGLSLLGVGYILYYSRQKEKSQRARSIVDRFQGAIWGACGSAIGLSVILVTVGANRSVTDVPPIHQYYICFISSMILGIAYFLSGIANDLKWLSKIGYAWWLGAIYMVIFPSVHVLGLYAAMIIVLQVVPGIILYNRYKKITKEAAITA
jgi:hypothetical protein